jgi:hypothetical protein
VRHFGRRGLISPAFAMLPRGCIRPLNTRKYALGYGQACMRLTIGGEMQPVLREMHQPACTATAA